MFRGKGQDRGAKRQGKERGRCKICRRYFDHAANNRLILGQHLRLLEASVCRLVHKVVVDGSVWPGSRNGGE